MQWSLIGIAAAFYWLAWGPVFAASQSIYDFEFAEGSAELPDDMQKQIAKTVAQIRGIAADEFSWVMVGLGDSYCELPSCPKQQLLKQRADKLYAELVAQGLPIRAMTWRAGKVELPNILSVRAEVTRWRTRAHNCAAELEVSDSRWPQSVTGDPLWLSLATGSTRLGPDSLLRLPALSGWEVTVRQGALKADPRGSFFTHYRIAPTTQPIQFSAFSSAAVRTVGDIPTNWPELDGDGLPACTFVIHVLP